MNIFIKWVLGHLHLDTILSQFHKLERQLEGYLDSVQATKYQNSRERSIHTAAIAEIDAHDDHLDSEAERAKRVIAKIRDIVS